MKISESLQSDYFQTLSWKQNGPKTLAGRIAVRLADALQQAVAENLELQHKEFCWHPLQTFKSETVRQDIPVCCGWNHSDWLAEADKLLRGEK